MRQTDVPGQGGRYLGLKADSHKAARFISALDPWIPFLLARLHRLAGLAS